MATGRTTLNNLRCYVDGYDMSGYARWIGPLTWEYQEADLTATMGDAVKGYLPEMPTLGVGTLAGVLDSTATVGMHPVMSVPTNRTVMVPFGIRAAPAAGDPVYCGRFRQLGYHAENAGGAVVVNMPFGQWSQAYGTADDTWESSNLIKPWGLVIFPKTSLTVSVDGTTLNHGAPSSNGAVLQVHIMSAVVGNVDITVQSSTTGAFAGEETPVTGMTQTFTLQGAYRYVATGAIKQYVRIEWTLGVGASVTAAAAFMRN